MQCVQKVSSEILVSLSLSCNSNESFWRYFICVFLFLLAGIPLTQRRALHRQTRAGLIFSKAHRRLIGRMVIHHFLMGLVAEPQKAHARAPLPCTGDESPAKRTGHLSPSTSDEILAKLQRLSPVYTSPQPHRPHAPPQTCPLAPLGFPRLSPLRCRASYGGKIHAPSLC
jgi:hypothetical protein